MKKRAIAVVLVWVIFLCFVWQFRTESYADPFTASQIGSLTYAMMQSWGINFTAGSATAGGMNDFMTNQVEDYVNSQGGSIADVFVGQIAVDVAGKLVVGQQMYNSVVGFVGWLKDKFGLSTSESTLTDGQYAGEFLPTGVHAGIIGTQPTGEGLEVLFYSPSTPTTGYNGYNTCAVYVNGTYKGGPGAGYAHNFLPIYSVNFTGTSVILYARAQNINDGSQQWRGFTVATISSLDNSLSWSVPQDWSMPTVLNPDKEWTGTIGGYSAPDTNLEDLLGDIDQAVADNNLVVDGEVIDVPIPPSPQPTVAPDIPLQDVPWEGLNDLIDNSTESVTESIGEAATDITGAIEGTQEAVESLEETITESLDVPAASEITGRKFDLSTLFPFCIPFDIYRMLQAFDGTPEAPHVQLPFVIQSIGFSYTFDLDFSAFDSVAAIMRTVEFIAFGIFLAFSTSKVIRW